MDAVGEVDVGAAWRAEENFGAIGQADVSVASGVVALVALGLDDDAPAAGEEESAADQLAGDEVNRAIEELGSRAALAIASAPRAGRHDRSSSALALTAARASLAWPIWTASGAEPVPPSIRFDSSQLLRSSTS